MRFPVDIIYMKFSKSVWFLVGASIYWMLKLWADLRRVVCSIFTLRNACDGEITFFVLNASDNNFIIDMLQHLWKFRRSTMSNKNLEQILYGFRFTGSSLKAVPLKAGHWLHRIGQCISLESFAKINDGGWIRGKLWTIFVSMWTFGKAQLKTVASLWRYGVHDMRFDIITLFIR